MKILLAYFVSWWYGWSMQSNNQQGIKLETGTRPISISDKPLTCMGTPTTIGTTTYGPVALWAMTCTVSVGPTANTVSNLKIILTPFGPVSPTVTGYQRTTFGVNGTSQVASLPTDPVGSTAFLLPTSTIAISQDGFFHIPISVTVTANQN